MWGTEKRSAYLLYLVSISAFLASLMQNIYSPLIPMLRDSFEVSISMVNLSVSLFILIVAVMQIAVGPIMDARGADKVLISGLSLTIAASIGCALASHYLLFLICRVLQAVGTAAIPLIAVTTISSHFQGNERGSAMGTYQMMLSIAPAVAPVLGGYIGAHYSYTGIFWFLTGISAIMLILCLLFFPKGRSGQKKPVRIQAIWKMYINIMNSKITKNIMLLGFIYFFIYFIILVFLPTLLVDHYEVSLQLVGLLYLPMALSNIGGTMVYKAAQAKWPQTALFLSGNIVAGSSLLLFAATESYSIFGLSIALILFGMSGGILMPLFMTMISQAFEAERASALGLFNFVRYVGMAAGPIFSGGWLAVLSDVSLFYMLGIVYGLITVVVCKPMIHRGWSRARG